MGFGNTIMTYLGLDLTAYEREAASAVRTAETASGEIARKFTAKEMFKGLMVGLGFNIPMFSQKLAEGIAGGSEEGWNSARDSAERYDKSLDDHFNKQLSNEKLLTKLKADRAEAQAQANAPRHTDDRFMYSGILSRTYGWGNNETDAEYTKRISDQRAKALDLTKQIEDLEQATKKYNETLADGARAREHIGDKEPQQLTFLRSEMDRLSAEADKAAKEGYPQEAESKRLQADKLHTQMASLLHSIAEDNLATEEKLAVLRADSAANLETKTEKLNRLRKEANDLDNRSYDITRSLAQRNADRVTSQQKLNEALALEQSLKTSISGIDDIAKNGGGSERGRKAREVQSLYQQAKEAEAQGNFDYADKLRARARAGEEQLERQTRDHINQTAQPPKKSAADQEIERRRKAFDDAIAKRSSDMDAGLQARQDRLHAEYGNSFKASPSVHTHGRVKLEPAASPHSELTDALDKSSVLKSIDDSLKPTAVATA